MVAKKKTTTEKVDEAAIAANEEVKVEVKAIPKSKPKQITIDAFCRIKAVKSLDAWAAKRFFSGLMTEKEWRKAFDEKKLEYKR